MLRAAATRKATEGAGGLVTRLFYSILYAVTLAAACAIWARQEENPALRDLIGARRANAQSPDPLNPGPSGMNPQMGGPGAIAPGMNGAGMNGMNGYNPNQAAANLNTMGTTRPEVDKPVSRPESWPGSPPPALPPQPPPIAGGDGLPGVSISSVPVIPGVGQSYSYKPGANAKDGDAAAVGQMSFSQPVESGPISPSQAAMAATSWSMAKEMEGTKILARVGTEYILAADVLGPVNEILARNAERIPPKQYDAVREQLIKQRLDALIQTKMVLDEVRHKVPEEGFKKFSQKIGEQFDKVEVPKAIEKSKLKTAKELDEDLHKTGSSLEREKRAFIERQISLSWIHQNAMGEEEVTHEQMVTYYREHEKEYEFPAKVRWEQIVVRFDRCPKSEAWRKLAEAGNHIVDGAPFAEVAKSVSQAPTASTGGAHDWTTKGSLVSESLDRALFTLPPGQLSPILEDARSFQIVRVIERHDAGKTSFGDTQQEIRRRIRAERNNAAMHKYVNGLRERVKVWTIFDVVAPDDLIPVKAPPPGEAPSSKTPPADALVPGQPAQPAAGPSSIPSTTPGYPVASGPPAAYPVAGNMAPQALEPTTSAAPPPQYPTTSAAPSSPPQGAARYR